MPTISVATIILHDGKVLIGKDTKGQWRVPGGAVNQFEKVQEAAERTYKETTGVDIKAEHILFVSEIIDVPNAEHRVVVYAYGQYAGGEAAQQSDSFTDIRWQDVRELAALQDEMSDEAVDAFFKFSMVLRQQAARAVPQG